MEDLIPIGQFAQATRAPAQGAPPMSPRGGASRADSALSMVAGVNEQ